MSDRLDYLVVAKAHPISSVPSSHHLLFCLDGHSGSSVTTANAAVSVLCTHFVNVHKSWDAGPKTVILDSDGCCQMLAKSSLRLRMLTLRGAECCAQGLFLEATRLRTEPGLSAPTCVSCPCTTRHSESHCIQRCMVGSEGRGTMEMLVPPSPECLEGETCSLSWGIGLCLWEGCREELTKLRP